MTARAGEIGADGALAIATAAYRMDGSEESWLEGIAHAAKASLDDGLGVHAVTFDVRSANDPIVVRNAVMIGKAARHREVFLAASAAMPARAYYGVVATIASRFGAEAAAQSCAEAGLTRTVGMKDALRIAVIDPDGAGVLVAAPLREPRCPAPPETRRLERVAAHLHTAFRARRRLAERAPDEVVFDPDGRVLHVERDVVSPSSLRALREGAVALDRARTGSRDGTLEAWRAMIAGRWTLVDRFERDGRRFVVARPNRPTAPSRRALSGRETICALYASMGHAQKLIAYELGLAQSTVSAHVRSAMRKLGATSRSELVRSLGAPVVESAAE